MCTALLVVMNLGFTVMNQKINDSRLFGCSKVKKSQQKSSVLEMFRKRWSRHLCQKRIILQQFLLRAKNCYCGLVYHHLFAKSHHRASRNQPRKKNHPPPRECKLAHSP
ncbi:unnamed protein product [Acanthoscelides obtectus]|uniref:Uncharacterized protein n=1 Tax=Acanthoscelides obtectus TaxID=200917 RepID=A0A9P0P045_ACAOB|nr:unnamed protein product [Acanthoscelides obtectus]CAK1668990.1 hypothetical protein AOBTE_LOCUS26728 [Acanthoscelides obtectus]